jgi:hypothetical protein
MGRTRGAACAAAARSLKVIAAAARSWAGCQYRRAYLIVKLPAMNSCYLLSVLVDESGEDGRASPNILRSDSGGGE